MIAIIRHGDRTPKQKMKMKVSLAKRTKSSPSTLTPPPHAHQITNKRLCSLVNKHGSDPLQDVVLKQPDQMTEVLDITRALIAEAQERAAAAAAGDGDTHSDDGEEDLEKLLQLRDVLETGGRFLGINRKVKGTPSIVARKKTHTLTCHSSFHAQVQIKPKRWAVRPVSPTRGPPKDAHHASPELSSLGLAQGTSPMQLFKPLTPSHGAQAEAVAAAAAAAAASKANAAEQSKKRNTELVSVPLPRPLCSSHALHSPPGGDGGPAGAKVGWRPNTGRAPPSRGAGQALPQQHVPWRVLGPPAPALYLPPRPQDLQL